jgi:hypothetical protein
MIDEMVRANEVAVPDSGQIVPEINLALPIV